MILGGFACFAAQIARLYRRRMRRALDIHIPSAVTAASAAILAAALLVTGCSAARRRAIALGGDRLARPARHGGHGDPGFFYKIATFLVC